MLVAGVGDPIAAAQRFAKSTEEALVEAVELASRTSAHGARVDVGEPTYVGELARDRRGEPVAPGLVHVLADLVLVATPALLGGQAEAHDHVVGHVHRAYAVRLGIRDGGPDDRAADEACEHPFVPHPHEQVSVERPEVGLTGHERSAVAVGRDRVAPARIRLRRERARQVVGQRPQHERQEDLATVVLPACPDRLVLGTGEEPAELGVGERLAAGVIPDAVPFKGSDLFHLDRHRACSRRRATMRIDELNGMRSGPNAPGSARTRLVRVDGKRARNACSNE